VQPKRQGGDSALRQVLLIALVVGVVLCLVAGVMWLTTVALGVGVLIAGCLLGILAHILQAGLQHDKRMEAK
jgi:Flp pilus assembly protein TadB